MLVNPPDVVHSKRQNVSVIAPEKGSEHFAQKGDEMRGAFPRQPSQRYSGRSILREQTTQIAG
jgi:hypothetical protein